MPTPRSRLVRRRFLLPATCWLVVGGLLTGCSSKGTSPEARGEATSSGSLSPSARSSSLNPAAPDVHTSTPRERLPTPTWVPSGFGINGNTVEEPVGMPVENPMPGNGELLPLMDHVDFSVLKDLADKGADVADGERFGQAFSMFQTGVLPAHEQNRAEVVDAVVSASAPPDLKQYLIQDYLGLRELGGRTLDLTEGAWFRSSHTGVGDSLVVETELVAIGGFVDVWTDFRTAIRLRCTVVREAGAWRILTYANGFPDAPEGSELGARPTGEAWRQVPEN